VNALLCGLKRLAVRDRGEMTSNSRHRDAAAAAAAAAESKHLLSADQQIAVQQLFRCRR